MSVVNEGITKIFTLLPRDIGELSLTSWVNLADQIMKNRILFDTRKLKQCYRKFLQYAATSNRTPAEM